MASADARPTNTASGLAGARRWFALLAAMMGTTVYMMTITTSGTAVPHIKGAFSAAPDQMAWLFTSFIIGTSVMTAAAGWCAARFGRSRLYLVAAIGFTAASALCGFATSFEELVLFRTLQGVFGAPLIPLGQAISIDVFPDNQQGLATVMWSIGGMMGSILGPIVGAILVENYGWPWVFFVNVPFGALAILLTWAFVPESIIDPARRLSWVGFGSLAVAIGAFQLMLNRAERLEWFESAEIVVEAGIAAIAFYVFVAHTALARRPFVSRHLFRDRNFCIALAFIFVYGSIVFLQLFLIPILLQDLAGYDIAGVAELLTWRGVGLISGMILIGPVSAKLDPRLILVFGFACLVGSAWGMSGSTLEVRAFDVAWTNFFQGMGAGVAYIPIVLLGLATLPASSRTEAVTLIYVVSNLGTATGTAAIFNFLVRNTQINRATMSSHLSIYNDVVHLGLLPRLWNMGDQGGLAAMEAELARNAAIIAYNDSFFLIALSAVVVLPLALFVRMPKRAP